MTLGRKNPKWSANAFNYNPKFSQPLQTLAPEVCRLAVMNFRLWLHDPRHPSIHFKKVGDFWSARVGSDHRALGIIASEGIEWFWIGSHNEYERIIAGRRSPR